MTRRSFLASMFLLFCEFRLNLRALADEDNSGYWYSGIIHVHSNFSDGIRQPKVVMSKAISSQASFLIVTDHYEQIDSLKKHLYQTTKNHGFSNYLDFFRSTSALIVLAGAEITAKQGDHNTHTLALGKIHQDSVLGAIQGQDNSQQAIVSRIKELGMLSVAAHPSVITAGSLSVSDPIEPTNYFYDRDNSRDLTGIEFGNEDPDRGKTFLPAAVCPKEVWSMR
ncbi:MAG: POLIIIAc protein [Candidatus Berkelbacteria bacterium]|nr:POLIIIAc protein [Candidatus Berkelbacteria bacterium]